LKEELQKIETVISSLNPGEKSVDKKGKKKVKKKKLEKAVKAIRKQVAKAIEGVKSTAESLVDRVTSADAGPTEAPVTAAKKSPKRATAGKAPAKASKAPAEAERKAEGGSQAPRGKRAETKATASNNSAEAAASSSAATPAKKTRTRRAPIPAAPTVEAATTVKRTQTKKAATKTASEAANAVLPASTAKKTPIAKPVSEKAGTASVKAQAVKTGATTKATPQKAIAKKAPKPDVLASFDVKATMDDKIRYALGQKKDSTKAELIDYLNGLDPDYGLTKLRKVVAFRLNHLLKTGQIKGKESEAGFRYAN